MNTSVPTGTIVVGVDGSAPSDRAVTWAAEQASLEGRALTLAHGVGLGEGTWLGADGVSGEAVFEAVRAEGQIVLDRAASAVIHGFPDVETRTVLPMTDPRLALLELAEQAAMVVVGSRGRGPVASLVLGSVSVAVTRHATCPVVVVRPALPGDRVRGILVGVDGTGNSAAAVEFAYRQASARALPLTVMHCFVDVLSTSRGPWQVPYDSPGLEEQRLILDATVNGMGEKFPDVPVTLTLGRGLVQDCLVHASQSMDMVVVGAHPKHTLIGLVFDPHVDSAVMEHAPCIVAVVPEGA
ncbi:MAG: universal stress protein [Marmoricola sp.]